MPLRAGATVRGASGTPPSDGGDDSEGRGAPCAATTPRWRVQRSARAVPPLIPSPIPVEAGHGGPTAHLFRGVTFETFLREHPSFAVQMCVRVRDLSAERDVQKLLLAAIGDDESVSLRQLHQRVDWDTEATNLG
eukprot:gene9503-59735_t